MIDKKLIPYSGLKKEPFSGSHHGMRYFFQGDDGKSSTTFTVYIYPEPWCFEETPEEEKEKKSAEEKPQLWGAQASIFTELELALTSELRRKVKVVCSGKDAGGSLQLQFFDEEDLRQLAQKLTKE